jgi:hypothetical protein
MAPLTGAIFFVQSLNLYRTGTTTGFSGTCWTFRKAASMLPLGSRDGGEASLQGRGSGGVCGGQRRSMRRPTRVAAFHAARRRYQLAGDLEKRRGQLSGTDGLTNCWFAPAEAEQTVTAVTPNMIPSGTGKGTSARRTALTGRKPFHKNLSSGVDYH